MGEILTNNIKQGKQLLEDTTSYFDIKPDYIQQSEKENDGKIYMTGILSTADFPNQNRRIYPKYLLEREFNKLLPLVKDGQVVGEIDHPACISEGNIMTYDGWKDIKDISDDEVILTLNLETNKPEYQKITKKINEPYVGEMYHIQGKNIDITVTPEHRFVVEDRHGKLLFKNAVELYDVLNKSSHLKILKSNSCWEVDSPNTFILKGVDANTLRKELRKDLVSKYTKDVEIDYNIWMSFIGIYLAEGNTIRTMRNKNVASKSVGYKVIISQKNLEKVKMIKELLSKFPKELKWTHTINKNGITTFSINDARLFNYLYPLGSCYDKYIPQELKNQSAPLLELLIKWYHIGDGRDVYYKGYNTKNIFSTSKKLMEDFQEIQLKIGKNGNIIKSITKKDYKFADHIIKAENKKPLYTLKFNESRYVHIDSRFLKITKENYNGRVYCVQVKNQTFYCENNGKCFWSGNSSVVSFQNASHKIVDMYWEGNNLLGKIQIIRDHPAGQKILALIKEDVKIGISSRALGSTESVRLHQEYSQYGDDVEVVSDDAVFITWDLVSNPSVQGAFMIKESTMLEWDTKRNNSLPKNSNYIYTDYDKELIYFIEKYRIK